MKKPMPLWYHDMSLNQSNLVPRRCTSLEMLCSPLPPAHQITNSSQDYVQIDSCRSVHSGWHWVDGVGTHSNPCQYEIIILILILIIIIITIIKSIKPIVSL
jgi:hypothetical protein